MHRQWSKRTDSGLLILKMYTHPTYVNLDHCGDIAAIFTAENDHNPLVAAKCPKCNGMGQWAIPVPDESRIDDLISENSEVAAGYAVGHGHIDCWCSHCNGSGVIDEPARLFNDDKPPETVRVNANGVTRCPNCGLKFSIKVRGVWTGWRHRCGQRLSIEQEVDQVRQ